VWSTNGGPLRQVPAMPTNIKTIFSTFANNKRSSLSPTVKIEQRQSFTTFLQEGLKS